VVMRLSDRVGSQAYPVPTPVVATSVKERQLLQTQRSFIAIKTLAEQAKATFVGIGQVAWNGPLHQEGFINDQEVAELIELGAVGEIAGWAYDSDGALIVGATNSRVASVPLEQPTQRLVIAVAGGLQKADSIRAALQGKLINGLVTDQAVAQAILAKSSP
jgi:DNA-binding transcriptional regulator LsrR (DeoR family)